MKNSMFERDILYPTQKRNEPGSVHVTVYPPENSGSIPIVVEAKTWHNPLDYMTDIMEILQTDVFNRIKIDIRKCGILFFKPIDDSSYNFVKFRDQGRYSVEKVEKIDSLI